MDPTRLWRLLKERIAGWREVILPGTLIISLVCIVRLGGLLQSQEWMALDVFSRHCPMQASQQHIAMVTIDTADYQSTGSFPISDEILAQAIARLQQYQPKVIGLDMLRAQPIGEGQAALQQILQSSDNIVAVEAVLSPEPTMNVGPPAGMSPDQIGFADIVVDADGKVRRIALMTDTDTDSLQKYSLSLQLARRYLQDKDIALTTEETDSRDPIRLGEVAISQFHPYSGGYVRADASNSQMLINFCQLQMPYATFSLRDLLAGNVNPQQLRDRIVIIGELATSAKESFITSAAQSTLYAQSLSNLSLPTKIIYSMEIHAHATQQIVHSVLTRPSFLETWPEPVEILWIIGWGLFGIVISVILQSPWKSILSLFLSAALLVALCQWSLVLHWWIPLVPAALALYGSGLATTFFDRDLRLELAQRRLTIERAYEAVHNGPLQHLAAILRSLGEQTLPPTELQQQLQSLNTEMRSIFEYLRQDTTARTDSFYLADSTVLDLRQPLSDLLYQVYEHTLSQPLPGFNTVQTYIAPNFEVFDSSSFTTEQKRSLCLFLQECLLNIGKHAIGATRIDVIATSSAVRHSLQIVDNGHSAPSSARSIGQGTRQATAIAYRLGGQFHRRTHHPQGTQCELSWPKK
ncbi:MAG: CHASE2 domain-containing protein [Cyanobacteria bacterium J06614_10]